MSHHASINRIFRLVFNEAHGVWEAVAETARGKSKRGGGGSKALRALLASVGLVMTGAGHAAAPPPPPAPTQLPTGSQVVAGQAQVSSSGAVLDVAQTSQRAVIDWKSFDVGSAAQVRFLQPGADSATLNRVLDGNPSQIAGRITAPGQVFLSNPAGVLFGKTASVDVGGLVATTHAASVDDFMAGRVHLTREGATGQVVNEGRLHAALGGYIALLAPEVRNQGVIIAQLGTVALAAGEAFTLSFEGRRGLTGLVVQPGTLKAVVDNQGAVLAPGGLVVLSAQALNRLQGAVVHNSGRIEATGLQRQGGRILLSSSGTVNNTGRLDVSAGDDGSPAGRIVVQAPEIQNSGVVVATDASAAGRGGQIEVAATQFTQSSTGLLDASAGAQGGQVMVRAVGAVLVQGAVRATAGAAIGTAGNAAGGDIALQSTQGSVTLADAKIDANGTTQGGRVSIEAARADLTVPASPQPGLPEPRPVPTAALLGQTEVRSGSRRGRGGSVVVTGERVGLFGSSVVEASGDTAGGRIDIGGGFQGGDSTIANARQTVVSRDARIDARARTEGDGGHVVVWSDERTAFTGHIDARGGDGQGAGGFVEVSGKQQLEFLGTVDASAARGLAGTLLLDPRDITVIAGGVAILTDVDQFSDNPSGDSSIAPATITAVTNAGTAVVLQANRDITIASSILSNNASGVGGSLSFRAGRGITVNASVISDDGNVSFIVNDPGADSNRGVGTASFVNNSQIDTGVGNVSITIGTNAGASGSITTGQIAARNLTIAHNGGTAGAVTGAIDLGETSLTGLISVTTSSSRNLVNTLGSVVVRGAGTSVINLGGGDLTLTRATTDLGTVTVTANEVAIVDIGAVRLGTSAIAGNLSITTTGPIASNGAVTVGGTATFVAQDGGFGYADPSITFNVAGNRFAGGVSLSVNGLGDQSTGGSATIRDTGALNIISANLAKNLSVDAPGITQTGAIVVAGVSRFTAGVGNDVTLPNAANDFSGLVVVSAKDATLRDTNGVQWGDSVSGGDSSTIAGNLALTVGGDITQAFFAGAFTGSVSVAGTSTFTAAHSAPIQLLMGTSNASGAGSANSLAGTVTLARANVNTGFNNVYFRNVSVAPGSLAGLNAVGTLNNVALRYDNTSSLVLPPMTVTADLSVAAPSSSITQSGVLSVGANSSFSTSSTTDVTLTNVGNSFNNVTVPVARNASITAAGSMVLYQSSIIFNDLTLRTVNGTITDARTAGNIYNEVTGTAYFNSGSQDTTIDNIGGTFGRVRVDAGNATVYTRNSTAAGTSNVTGTLLLKSTGGGVLTQVSGSTLTTGSTTTFDTFNGGVTLTEAGNALGPVAMTNIGPVQLRENDAITQASAWSIGDTIRLTTSNDQAITLTQPLNILGPLVLTQINNGAVSAGSVSVVENNSPISQAAAWTTRGSTTLNAGTGAVILTDINNVLGPLRVSAGSVELYAKAGAGAAISDAGASGPWNVSGQVRLIGYSSAGVAGSGDISLTNFGNTFGDLYLKGANVAITEADSITDGPSTSWNAAGDTAWRVSGTLNLRVIDPAGRSITLDNITNSIGPVVLETAGAAGTLSNVVVTDNGAITQAGAWLLGAAPVTLDARNNAITLNTSGNVMGALNITTINGVPTSVTIREDDAITQGSPWILNGVPVTLTAENGKAVTLASATNVLGDVTITGGAVSLRENDAITQAAAWTTTGTTTLNAGNNAITLNATGNVFGDIAIAGAPSALALTANADITQASAWVIPNTPVTLNAPTRNINLGAFTNRLGNLVVNAGSVALKEDDPAGITGGGAWAITGNAVLDAGTAPIVLEAGGNNFNRLSFIATTASVTDSNGIDLFNVSTSGLATINAGGTIVQSGGITAPSLRLIGTGNAVLTDVTNNVGTLAAGFSGGALSFTNAGNLAIGPLSGTSGITIGARAVSLRSVSGTVTGLTNINAATSALTLDAGATTTLPTLSIAGPQTYTSGGSGLLLTASLTSTGAGAITFNSPVALTAPLTVQSSNSNINFGSTLAGGNNRLTVTAGTGLATFTGAVTALGQTADSAVSLTLSSAGATFSSTLAANNGLSVTGPVTFLDTVTLANGNAGSVFAGAVTLGKVGGMSLSGFDGLTFNNGVTLQNGAATIDSNNAPMAFQTAGTVSGPYALTLNAGSQTISGLSRLGSNLTGLTLTAASPSLPAGLSIAGPQLITATGVTAITLNGDVTSTAAGSITFASPVELAAASTITTVNSDIAFQSTINGARNLTVASGSGNRSFGGAIGGITALGTGTGAALVLQGSGASSFAAPITARSGITAAGATSFAGNIALANGDTGSTFTGLVTSGGVAGNTFSGFDGISFGGGLTLTGGPVVVLANGSTIALGGTVTGAQQLTLNALAGGTGTVTGLNQIGTGSTLTRLDVTGQTLSLPASGLAVAGPMNFTAAGGITLNGPVGLASSPITGAIAFNGPVNLATGAVTVSTNNANIGFSSTINGAQALSLNAGTGTVTLGGAVGVTTALGSLATDAGGSTVLQGGSVRTTGAQTYGDAVSLGAATTLTASALTFASTLNGAQALVANVSGATTFSGAVGGSTALASITTDGPGTVVFGGGSVATTGAQTYGEAATLTANTTLTGTGVSLASTVDGAQSLTVAAGAGSASFGAAVGGSTALSALTVSGGTAVLRATTTTGAQSITAAGGLTLNGNLNTSNSDITLTAPVTLAGAVIIATGSGAGNITLVGSTSTINGAQALTLSAGTGDVSLGGVVGGSAPLTAVTISGRNLAMPVVRTVGDINQSYTALNDLTLTQSRTLNAAATFAADSDGDGSGSFILPGGVALTLNNAALSISAADLDLAGTSSISAGSGVVSIEAAGGRNLSLGGSNAAGQMTISGTELQRITTTGGLNLRTSGSGWVRAQGITAAQSQNITGTLALHATGTGDVGFVSAPSEFNAVLAQATGGTIELNAGLTTSNDAITFATPTVVGAGVTLASGGGAVAFQSGLVLDGNLAVATGNGNLSFGGAVSGAQALGITLGGGTVGGLAQLQPTLTGLSITGTAAITLPALTINGAMSFNTGAITLTGDLQGIGLTLGNSATLAPASGNGIALNAGTGTLTLNSALAMAARDLVLTGDEIDIAGNVTGTGALTLQPSTPARNVSVNGTGLLITGLNLTSAELARLPLSTLAGLTVGRASGSGSLDVAGVLNVGSTALTLNGGGGITQSGGAIAAGPLTLYAAGNAIQLANGANAFVAVAINGAPSAVTLGNTLNITQQGTAGWALGSAPVTLTAPGRDIVLTNSGNSFGTLTLTGRNANVAEAAATELGAAQLGGYLQVASTGDVTQSGALNVAGALTVSTSANLGDVVVDNSGATATSLGNSAVGGSYTLVATGQPVYQGPGTSLQVRGNLTVTGNSIVLDGAGNLVGGTITLPSSTTAEIRQAGVITLGNRSDVGNLTVVSERAGRSFTSGVVAGAAITLNNAANTIGGAISVSASPPTTALGPDQQTGIVQTAGTSISVAGTASFTAEPSSAGSLGVVLGNTGNSFGALQVSANVVQVRNDAIGTTTLGPSQATTNLSLTTAGAVAQVAALSTPLLTVNAAGGVALTQAGNAISSFDVTSSGGGVALSNSGSVLLAGLNAGGGNVALVAGGAGNVTQTAALQGVAQLTVQAGGSVVLDNSTNAVGSLAASQAGMGFSLRNSQALTVANTVRTVAGSLVLRAAGGITLTANGRLQADAGGVVVSTEGAGEFINLGGASALVVGSGSRWLVYSSTPDLVPGVATVKGGLSSAFRRYGATFGSYAPGAVNESGNGYIYSAAAPTLTVRATVVGSNTQVYGNAPTGTLSYTIAGGLVDSEDSAANIITGGTAIYSGALNASLNAGNYSILYTSGLQSPYTLVADTVGAAYTVTPAVLQYVAAVASRTYGAANPALAGTVTGFKLGQTTAALGGAPVWATTATAATPVGQVAITGSGYTASNYTFAQAGGNANALSVTPAALTVTANALTRVYDASSFSGGNGVAFSGFVNGEDASVLAGSVAFGGSSQGARNAGSYVIAPSGLSAGNYALSFASGSLTVSRANLVLTPVVASKTYDGSLAVAGTARATAGTTLFGSDTFSGGSFAYTIANAGQGNRTVNVTGVSLADGNGGNNYNLSYVASGGHTTLPAALSVSTFDVSKTYDGSTAAAGTLRLLGGTLYANASNGGATDSLSGGSFSFATANAGLGNRVVATSGVNVNDGNGGGNYAVSYVDNTTSTITPRGLVFSGTVAIRQYDGGTQGQLAGFNLAGLVGAELLQVNAGSVNFSDANAGVGKFVAIGGLTLGNGTGGGLAANYSLPGTASATGTILPRQITAVAQVANKVYDRTTAATVNGFVLQNLVGSETLSSSFSGSASFADRNVGSQKTVTVTGVGLGNGSNGGQAANYALAGTATGTASSTPAPLQAVGLVALDKVYDGTLTTALSVQSAVVSGVLTGDTVSLSTVTGSFQSKDVGQNKSVVASAFSLAGADAINYALVGAPTLTASITPRALLVTATGADKTYDGNTSASAGLQDNRVAGDSLLATGSAAFLDRHAGSYKFITVTGIAISGTDAGNYAVNTTASAFGSISRAQLTLNVAAQAKVYDGTTAASATLTDGRFAGDQFSLSYGLASFADKNVGVSKVVSLGGIFASGPDANNYIVPGTASALAAITPATLVVNASGVNRVYDGSTNANVTWTDNRLAGDRLVLTAADARFSDKNAGTGKTVTVGGITLSGADAQNYDVASQVNATASITPAVLQLGVQVAVKVYDGSTSASVNLSDNRVTGDQLVIGFGASLFADKNVGIGKAVTVGGLTLAGLDALNYTLPGIALGSGNITPRMLAISASAQGRVYDGSTNVTVTLADNRVAGDQLALDYGQAGFADKNAGVGKTVTVNGIRLAGVDAGNYNFARELLTQGNITKALLGIVATGVDRPYNGSLAATVTLTDNRFGNDALSLSYAGATFADKNAGTGKAITVTGISLGGADAGNYDWIATTNARSTVAPAVLPVSVVVVPKVYDGTTQAEVQLRDGRVAGDDLTLGRGAAAFSDPNPGTGKAVTVVDIAISGGADRGNYVLQSDRASGSGIVRSLGEGAGSTETAALPPVVAPTVQAPQVPRPAELLDPTLPGGFAGLTSRPGLALGVDKAFGMAAGSGPVDAATVPLAAGTGNERTDSLSVTLVRDPAGRAAGHVAVLVPKSMLEAGKGFGFPLPAEMAAMPGADQATITLLDGQPLPTWLSYQAAAKNFGVTSVPAGALPLQALVRIGGQRWTVVISER